jgi:hypothetical protein
MFFLDFQDQELRPIAIPLRKPLYKICSNVRRVQIMLGSFLTPKLEVEKQSAFLLDYFTSNRKEKREISFCFTGMG